MTMPLRDDVLNDSLNVMLERIRNAYPGIDAHGQINFLGDKVEIEVRLQSGMVLIPTFQQFNIEDLDSEDPHAVRWRCDAALKEMEDQIESMILSILKIEPKE